MGLNAWRIQITTDETVMLLALGRAYRNLTLAIITATDADQALAQLESADFHLMLLDLDMRTCCGFELLREVSRRRADIPLLLLTTADTGSPELLRQIEAARPSGCWHLLEKPFDLKKLSGFIERGLLERSFAETAGSGCTPPRQNSQRHCHRFRRHEPITIGLAGVDRSPSYPATLTDISVGGIGLRSRHELPLHQKITFEQNFPHQTGVVVWCAGAGQDFRAGVRFT